MAPSSQAHDASAWDSHAAKWRSSVQAITLGPCTELIDAVDSILPFSEESSSSRITARDTEPKHVLDNGSGAGMITTLLKTKHSDLRVTATDLSPSMLAVLDEHIQAEGWTNVTTKTLNAEDLAGLPDDTFSHVLCTFVISFCADPARACREMFRVGRGAVGLATWSRVSWVPIWEKARRSLAGQADYQVPTIFAPATMEAHGVRGLLEDAGFGNVKVWTYKCMHPEKNADAAVEEFYGMGNPTVKLMLQGLTEEDIEATKETFKKAWTEDWGETRQYEVAICATGDKL